MDRLIHFPSAAYLKDFPDFLLKEQFEEAVCNGWPEEWIDRVLDEKNRRDKAFRNSLRIDFSIAHPFRDFILVSDRM